MSGLRAVVLLALFVACRGWVIEGQLKKKVRFIGALLWYKLACLVEGLYVAFYFHILTTMHGQNHIKNLYVIITQSIGFLCA